MNGTIHLRVVGWVWLVFGIIIAAWLGLAILFLSPGWGSDPFLWLSHFIPLAFLLLSAAVGFGLVRLHRWAQYFMRGLAVILLLACVSYPFIAGLEIDIPTVVFIALLALFAAYSFAVACISRLEGAAYPSSGSNAASPRRSL